MQLPTKHLLFALTLLLAFELHSSNNNVNKIERDLAPFEEVTLNGNFNVTLVQGNAEHIIITGREKSLAEIEIIESNGKLRVEPFDDHRVRHVKKVEITLYYKTMRKLELNGISGIACATPIRGDHLRLDCNGIRDLELNLDVETLDCVFNGMGTAYLHGSAKAAEIEYSGIGNLEAFDLVTERMDVESAGIGRVEVHAVNELRVEASGIGSVRYLGNPTVKRLDGTGIGKIKRARS